MKKEFIKSQDNRVLEGLTLIKPEIHKDSRGIFLESWNKIKFRNLIGENIDFVQDNYSSSKRNVLRGLHGDKNTWKLVSCLQGEFFLAVVNFDKTSKQFCKHHTFVLNGNDNYQVLIPPSFGNGHLVLSEKTIFHYKQSTYYEGMEKQFTLRWDDPKLNITWPTNNPILSKRDLEASFI